MTASAKSAERSLRRFFGTQDMTQGNPMRNLLMFSIPLLIGNLAQQLYSTADSIIVGNFVGDNALAAVGASGPVINLLLVLFMAISTGVGIMVSQYFGARDRDALSRSIGNALVLVLITGVLMTVAGVALSRPIMEWLDTPVENDVLEMSVTYLTIIFAGIIGPAIYNMVSGILRGMGDSVTPADIPADRLRAEHRAGLSAGGHCALGRGGRGGRDHLLAAGLGGAVRAAPVPDARRH